MCIQDENNGNLLLFNSLTGAYKFMNCSGIVLSGTGVLTRNGSIVTIQHNAVKIIG